jgi:hypothetical protein
LTSTPLRHNTDRFEAVSRHAPRALGSPIDTVFSTIACFPYLNRKQEKFHDETS